MPLKRIAWILENELKCVRRAGTCDRKCDQCELVLPDYEIIEAYEQAIKLLRQWSE